MREHEQLLRALEIVAGAAAPTAAPWLIGGSTGLLLRGMALPRPPRDLDLYADDADAASIHDALRAYAVDEQQVNVSPIYRSVLSHYDIHGVQVELVGGFVVASGSDRYAVEVREMLNPMRLQLTIGAHPVGLVPLAHELWFNVLRARFDRVELIGSFMREDLAAHRAALQLIAARNNLSEAIRKQVEPFIQM
ncbi:nucleotidyltransferase domain-containing protein [Paenibacillus sp. R14(2021)]|uniref:nucleotidyltransferase domain-containing protein n=1 Tax=Paenibacillus sp. R14(2021) TaxID=2859228 RepID=UPI001C611F74|nr:hypothetical protein [Paenibacillus sp. R14(2021)]